MDHLIGTIKQLPQVLQNEIWEYVRGDRTYWKQQFKPITHIVKYIHKQLWDDVENFEESGRAFLTVGIDEKFTDYVALGWNGQSYFGIQCPFGPSYKWTTDFGQVAKDFYRRIEYMVVKHNF